MRAAGVLFALGFAVTFAACQEADREAPRGMVGGTGLPIGGIGATTGGGEGPDLSDIPDPEAPCDGDIPVDEADPRVAARAIELCTDADAASDWGVVSAAWVLADGSDDVAALSAASYALGHGVLTGFGDEIGPLAGARLLALSSGTARQPDDPDWENPAGYDKGYDGAHPGGFPKAAPKCGSNVVSGPAFDHAALEVVLRPPTNALAFAFDFDFYTFEWPAYVCSQFNDVFATLLDPRPEDQSDGNISFDQAGNPVSVNNAFVRVCDCAGGPPCSLPSDFPKIDYTCELGAGELSGTGFEDHAATGWLTTEAPVTDADQIILRFAVYDAGDGDLDTTVLIDNFRWREDSGGSPITEPK